VTEAMCAVSELYYETDNYEIQPRINVHDDLTYLMREQALNTNVEIIAREMCRHRFDYINVPLVVEAQIGKRWHELKEIKVYRSDEIFNLENPYAR